MKTIANLFLCVTMGAGPAWARSEAPADPVRGLSTSELLTLKARRSIAVALLLQLRKNLWLTQKFGHDEQARSRRTSVAIGMSAFAAAATGLAGYLGFREWKMIRRRPIVTADDSVRLGKLLDMNEAISDRMKRGFTEAERLDANAALITQDSMRKVFYLNEVEIKHIMFGPPASLARKIARGVGLVVLPLLVAAIAWDARELWIYVRQSPEQIAARRTELEDLIRSIDQTLAAQPARGSGGSSL